MHYGIIATEENRSKYECFCCFQLANIYSEYALLDKSEQQSQPLSCTVLQVRLPDFI